MRAFVVSVALMYLLTWTEADKQTHLKRVQLQRRARHGRTQQGSRPGSGSALSVLSPRKGGEVQADESARVSAGTGAVQTVRARGQGLVPGRRGAGQANIQQDEGAPGARTRGPSGAGSPNLLASFAGKNRVLVISAPHESDGYFRLMMSLLKPDVYCELAERHVHQIVLFHQEGETGGKVRRITAEGKVMEEPLDTALIPRLMSFLKLEKGKVTSRSHAVSSL